MEKDYYSLLKVNHDDSIDTVRQKFEQRIVDTKQIIRNLGRTDTKTKKKTNDKSRHNNQENEETKLERSAKKYHCLRKFEEYLSDIHEAYSVLSDPKLRAFYDHFGFREFNSQWKVLLMDTPVNSASKVKLDRDIRNFIFKNNRLMHLNQKENLGQANSSKWWAARRKARPLMPVDLEVEVQVTLAEIFQKQSKEITFQRNLYEPFSSRLVSKTVKKKLLLGYYVLDCDTISFKGEGHSSFEHGSSDLVVRFNIQGHPDFKRNGLDLVYTKRISLKEALTCTTLSMKHLDEQVIDIPVLGVISPQTVIKIPNKGFFLNNNRLEILQRLQFSENISQGEGYVNNQRLLELIQNVQNPETHLLEQNSKRVSSAQYFRNQNLKQSDLSRIKNSKSKDNLDPSRKLHLDSIEESHILKSHFQNNIFDFNYDINVSNVNNSLSSSFYGANMIKILNEDYCNSVIQPAYVYGDLYVIFDIAFPTSISKLTLSRISSTLNKQPGIQ
jgi:DnaJ family protein B protein 4